MPARLFLAAIATSFVLATAAQADELRDLCPDRPGKGTATCTVDAGHFQIESEVFSAAYQRRSGVTTDSYAVGTSVVKFGVTDNWDIEAIVAPYAAVRTHNGNNGRTQSIDGVGDFYLQTKVNILGNDDSAFTLAVNPWVKLPTARIGIGNGAVETALVVPMGYDLGDGWSLGSSPEIDVLKNAANSGRHLGIVDLVGVNRAIGGGVTLGAELWGAANFDATGTVRQYSFDLDAAWQPESDGNVQYDVGVNRGLNGNTPAWQAYIGITRRF